MKQEDKELLLKYLCAALPHHVFVYSRAGNDYTLTIVKENLQYQLYYRHAWDQTQDIEIDYYDDMIDACYEMILKLKEENLL